MEKEFIASWFRQLQDDICRQLEAADGASFRQDEWHRAGGGGGRTRILEGHHIEKGGVNFSAVHGELPEKIARALQLESAHFFATGVSIVLHPRNPMVPIIHSNVRYFEVDSGVWWFGGGIDLTPHYIVPTDAVEFHRRLKTTCDAHHPSFYPEFKEWADRYFYLPHRGETRGVGGIFFDRLDTAHSGLDKAACFAFVQAVGNTFCPAYLPLLNRYKDAPYGEEEKRWQSLRRGRYVEFNLVWDKGTRFGLDTDGRTESILMSLPPMAAWVYDFQPLAGSREAATQEWLQQPGINYTE